MTVRTDEYGGLGLEMENRNTRKIPAAEAFFKK
jgi:hypothetical protein